MEPLFEIQGVQEKEQYLRLNAALSRENKLSLLCYVLAAMMFVLMILTIWSGEIFSAVFTCGAGIFLLFMPKMSVKGAIKQLEEKANIFYGNPFTIRFFEDEIIEFTPYSEVHVPYAMVYRVLETEEDIFVFIAPSQAICIRKNEVQRGSAHVLVRFLREYKYIPYKFV